MTPDWILDCDAHGTKLSESAYHPSLLEFDNQTATVEALNGPSSAGEHEEIFTATENEMSESFQNKTDEQMKSYPSTSSDEKAAAELSSSVEQKLQAWDENSTSSVLEGIVFHIIDYPQCVGEETIKKWKKVRYILIK